MNKVFPPGAAQQSIMFSPGCGSTIETTNPAVTRVVMAMISNHFSLSMKYLQVANSSINKCIISMRPSHL